MLLISENARSNAPHVGGQEPPPTAPAAPPAPPPSAQTNRNPAACMPMPFLPSDSSAAGLHPPEVANDSRMPAT
eukprot:12894680-Prorocentrum_lima.AAC.1